MFKQYAYMPVFCLKNIFPSLLPCASLSVRLLYNETIYLVPFMTL